LKLPFKQIIDKFNAFFGFGHFSEIFNSKDVQEASIHTILELTLCPSFQSGIYNKNLIILIPLEISHRFISFYVIGDTS
jgi:hypothetical protein